MRVATSLALHGGEKTVVDGSADLFAWPIVTPEDEAAVLDVLRRGRMSHNEVTLEFEREIAAWHGVPHALGYCNGTASLLGAMWACGVGAGSEIIAPSLTYWASVLPALSLGGSVVFADVQPDTLCIDPNDLEHRITPRTKAIVVVHLYGHPCDMDPILALARRHHLKVIEDVSHAHGGFYKGRRLGTLGDVACMSLMSGKALACGEGGMLLTSDRELWERAVAFGFYERTGKSQFAQSGERILHSELQRFAGMPLGGHKHRMNQTCSAMGRVQLKHYAERMKEIQAAMNLFWDCLEGTPGIRPHRVARDSGSTMGGWYCAAGHYLPEELGGLPLDAFCKAVTAEGVRTARCANAPLHLHPLLHEADVYGHGRPTVLAHSDRDTRQGPGSLPKTEATPQRILHVPWFKHLREEPIRRHAEAFRKVAEHAEELGKDLRG